MITKKQWNKFCTDVWYLRSTLGYDAVWMEKRGIKSIEQRNRLFEITTVLAGTPPVVYKYKDSFEPRTNLQDLYRRVDVKGTLDNLCPYLKKGGSLL